MPTTVTKYEFPNCVFEVNFESFFEREVEEIGHDFFQLTNNQCQSTLGRSRAIEIVLLDIHRRGLWPHLTPLATCLVDTPLTLGPIRALCVLILVCLLGNKSTE